MPCLCSWRGDFLRRPDIPCSHADRGSHADRAALASDPDQPAPGILGGCWSEVCPQPGARFRGTLRAEYANSRDFQGGSMRSARNFVPTLALLAAAACSSISATQSNQPAPALRRSASTAATLGIPPGHLPPSGQCRIWLPGEPPGHQPRSRSCAAIERAAPAGSWIVYRPSGDRKVVHVRVIDERRAGVVVHLRVYDVDRGTLIRES